MISKEVFAKGIGFLVACYKNAEVPADTIRIWHEELQEFDPRVFERVIKDITRTSKFFPSFAEIYQAMILHSGFSRVSGDEKWEQILNAAQTGEKPALDEISERALQAAGGWDRIQFTSYKDLKFLKRNFVDVYNNLAEKTGGGAIGIEHKGQPQKQLEDLDK